MRPGPPPKPTALRILEGNPGQRPLNHNEPKPPACDVPRCPDWLDDVAKAEWQRLAGTLHKMGLLTEIDRFAFAAYCMATSLYRMACESIIDNGATYRHGDLLKKNPMVEVRNRAERELHTWAAEFGLSPSSRSRLSVSPIGQQPNRLEKFLAKQG